MAKAEIPAVFAGLPVLTAEQARELDRLATERFGIPAEKLMENAGQAVAQEVAVFVKTLGALVTGARVVVCCGRGANGGDGLVAARVLVELGMRATVFLCPAKKDESYPALVKANLERAIATGVAVKRYSDDAGLEEALAAADCAIDALLGTGSAGKPAGPVRNMIQALTRAKKPVVAVDLPSGIHPDTGYHSGVFVVAALTLTLGFPKRGLLTPHAASQVGTLKVLDIGYPEALAKA